MHVSSDNIKVDIFIRFYSPFKIKTNWPWLNYSSAPEQHPVSFWACVAETVSPVSLPVLLTARKPLQSTSGPVWETRVFPVQVVALPCGTPAVRSHVVHQDPARGEAPCEEETLPLLLTPMQQCSAMFKAVLALYVPKHCMWPARLNNAFISAFSTSGDFPMQLILAIVLLPSAPANYVY